MNPKEAVTAYAQSEKVKAGLIWTSQCVNICKGLRDPDGQGAVRVLRMFLDQIYHDVHLAASLCNDDSWRDVEKHMDMAMVMIDSGVVHESTFHLTRALSQVTDIGRRAMTVLTDHGLF